MGHQKVLKLPCSEPKNQKLNEKTHIVYIALSGEDFGKSIL